MPKCPKCGGSNLWDDNLWEGCNDCDYLSRGFTVERVDTGERVGQSMDRWSNLTEEE